MALSGCDRGDENMASLQCDSCYGGGKGLIAKVYRLALNRDPERFRNFIFIKHEYIGQMFVEIFYTKYKSMLTIIAHDFVTYYL